MTRMWACNLRYVVDDVDIVVDGLVALARHSVPIFGTFVRGSVWTSQ